MLSYLREHEAPICRVWFDDLVPLGVAGGALELRTPGPIERDYLRAECSTQFHDAARTISGMLMSVRFLAPLDASQLAGRLSGAAGAGPAQGSAHVPQVHVLAGSSLPATHQSPPTHAASTSPTLAPSQSSAHSPRPRVTIHEQPGFDSVVINPDFSFDQFVIGSNNRLAHAAAQAVADSPGTVYNPLFIHGGVGLGKTHLLQAICQRIIERYQRAKLLYISCEGFVTQYVDSVRTGRMSEFRARFRGVDVLIIDDIHFLDRRDQSQEEFFHTFNELKQLGRQIILSSDASPEDVPELEARLVSRFRSGLVVKVEPPDFETRIEILKRKAQVRGFALSNDVAQLIAGRLSSNIRELEGAVVRLQIQSLVEKAPITLALARTALGDAPAKAVPFEPTIQQVVALVADYAGVKVTDMQGKQRNRSIAAPRHLAMFLARKCTKQRLEQIGGYLGGRDHTTVLHAVKSIEERIAAEPDFGDTVASLEDKLRNPELLR
jgi:chromosomal replication initiator protein